MRTLKVHDDGTTTLLDAAGCELACESALDAARREKRWELESHAIRAEGSGFQFAGNTYASDSAAQQRITLNVLLAMRKLADFPMDWELPDGNVVTLQAQDMLDLGVALAEHLDAVQTTVRDLHARIRQAASVQEVQAIVWP